MFEHGTVTTENIEEVADRLRDLLSGGPYTTVHCFEYNGFKPEVRLHQELGGSVDGDDVSLHFHSSEHAQVIISDTYGSGGFSTIQTEPGYDPEFRAPYAAFERNGQFAIKHRAPNGLLILSVYAPE